MSKVNAFETSILGLIFNGTAIADLAANDASSPSTTLWVSLHTADPGDAGTQATNEATYTGYARIATDRTTGGWVVSSGQAFPAAAITFPNCTAGSDTITHASVGLSSSGAGTALYNGTVTSNISVSANITPRLSTDSAIGED